MKLSLAEVRSFLGAAPAQHESHLAATGYSIDSRSIRPGDLFFAIAGPRFDGHDFVGAAFERGAAGAVVERSGLADRPGLVRVKSTVQALQSLAQSVRRTWGKQIIGVTGSAGKTTTKEMIALVLSKRYSVHKSAGNLNNEFGLPLCLLQIEPQHELAVLEMGMSAAGEIRRLAAIAEPNEGVVTNVHPVHLEFFESIGGIADAKFELLQGLTGGSAAAYLNFDDPHVREMAKRFAGRVVSFGSSAGCDFHIAGVENRGLEGSGFRVRHHGSEWDFSLPLPGVHNTANALPAIAVGASHNVPWRQIQEAIAECHHQRMRGEVIRLRDGITVVNDADNSNPAALRHMVNLVAGLKTKGRRWLIAGEMRELGKDAALFHAEAGKHAIQAGFDRIVAVQGAAKDLADGALAAGAAAGAVLFADNAELAAPLICAAIQPGDLVLVKGSRGVRLEVVVDALRAAFKEAVG